MRRQRALNLPVMMAGAMVLLAAVPSVRAETSVSYTLGNSTGDYVSHAIDAGFDVKVIPVEARLDALQASSGGAEVLNQYGVALTWRPVSLLSFKYKRSGVKDTTFSVNGNELGASLHLDGLIKDKLETRFDFGATALDYGLRVNAPALDGLVPDQRRQSFGIRQDLTQGLSLYATFDQYSYSRDPVAIARFLVTRRKPRVNAAFSLVDFPDLSRNYGFSWGATDKLDLDFSFSQTDSVIGQRQQTLRLAGTWAATQNASVTLAASQTATGAVVLPNGTPLIDEQRGSTVELTLGWSFN